MPRQAVALRNVAKHEKMPVIAPGLKKKRRYIQDLTEQELQTIENEYIKTDGISINFLADKYDLYSKQLGFFALRRNWVSKRKNFFRPIQRQELKPIKESTAKSMGLDIINASVYTQKSVDKDRQEYLDKKSRDRSMALQQLREKITLSLHCTQADIDLYLEEPDRLIRECENMAIDKDSIKNTMELVTALEKVIKLERIEDGLSNNPKDRPEDDNTPIGRLVIVVDQDGKEMSQELGHAVIDAEIEDILT